MANSFVKIGLDGALYKNLDHLCYPTMGESRSFWLKCIRNRVLKVWLDQLHCHPLLI